MKGKFSSMGRVVLALVLALSLSLVMAAPVAADVSAATVTFEAGKNVVSIAAQYTISFTTTVGMAADVNSIVVTFPDDTTITDAEIVANEVTVKAGTAAAVNVAADKVTVVGQVATIVVPTAVPAGAVTVVFLDSANVRNPSTAGSYNLSVHTDVESTDVASAAYSITLPPGPVDVYDDSGIFTGVYTPTIQGAISHGSTTTGYTLKVHAGTYAELLTISKEITLESQSGAAATTIDVSSAQDPTNPSTSIGIAVSAVNVTITGFTIIGVPTVTDSLAEGFGVSSSNYPTIKATANNLKVEDCIFTVASGKVGHAALLVDTGVTGVNFLRNEVTNYIYGVTAKTGVNSLTVTGNTFNQSSYLEDPDLYGRGYTMYLCKGVQVFAGNTLKVTDNTFTGPATLEGEFDTDALKDIIAIHGPHAPASSETYTGNNISNYSCGIFSRYGGTISKNDIDACTVGIMVGQRRADSVQDLGTALTISQNDITNSLNRGIWVQPTGIGNAVTVKYNTIAGNADYGMTNEIVSGTATAGNTTTLTDTSQEWDVGNVRYGFVARGVKADDRVVNVTTGLTATVDGGGIAAQTLTVTGVDTGFTFSAGDSYRVEAQVNVSAKYNWWGHIGGPSASAGETALLGSGDVLSSQMGASLAATDYDPWLTTDQATAISDGIAYHGSIYPLEAGWNTLSVPLALDDGADTLSDIVALGDFIISDPEDLNQNYLGGYYYDAVNRLWVELPGAYEFVPCKAVYVKMAEDASFPVLYSGVFGLPSVSLPTGWNLIGSGFGVDKTVDVSNSGTTDVGDYGVASADVDSDGDPVEAAVLEDTESYKTVKTALASLGDNVSVVISPSLPGQTAPWGTVATDNSTKMIVGEGYWVFLTAPATLAGFEVTPIYWINLP